VRRFSYIRIVKFKKTDMINSPRKRSHSLEMSESNRVNSTLHYLSGAQGPLENLSEVDNDMYSLLMFNSDLMTLPQGGLNVPMGMSIKSDDSSDEPKEPEKKKQKMSKTTIKKERKKRSASSTLTEAEKEAKRMANRINSRKFRLRQRQKIDHLKSEVEKLREQNRQLQIGLHLAQQNGGDSTSGGGVDDKPMDPLENMPLDNVRGDVKIPPSSLPVSALRESHIRELESLVLLKRHNKETTEKMETIVKEHVAFFADAGRTRKRLLRYHVNMLKRLMLPTQVTKLCVWGLQQDDEFFDDTKTKTSDDDEAFVLDHQDQDDPSLWQIICNKLELTDKQKAGIMENRKHVGAQRSNIKDTMDLIAKLDAKINDTVSMNKNLLDSIMGQITPLQQAKYLVWQEQNGACMQMLEHLWRTTS